MKKFLIVLLAAFMATCALSFAGCKDKTETSSGKGNGEMLEDGTPWNPEWDI